jgi:hypothetical protein
MLLLPASSEALLVLVPTIVFELELNRSTSGWRKEPLLLLPVLLVLDWLSVFWPHQPVDVCVGPVVKLPAAVLAVVWQLEVGHRCWAMMSTTTKLVVYSTPLEPAAVTVKVVDLSAVHTTAFQEVIRVSELRSLPKP